MPVQAVMSSLAPNHGVKEKHVHQHGGDTGQQNMVHTGCNCHVTLTGDSANTMKGSLKTEILLVKHKD